MVKHNMFVFGGNNGTDALGDLIVLDVRTSMWSRPRTSAPPRPRGNHAAAAVEERLIIFGGSTGGTFYADCAVLDTASRSTSTPLNAALGRPAAGGAVEATAAAAARGGVLLLEGPPQGEEGSAASAPAYAPIDGKRRVTFGAASKGHQLAIKGPTTDGGEERDRQAMLALKGPDDRGPSDPNMALVVAGGGSPTKQPQIDPAKAEADAASRDVVTLMERLRYAEREKQEALEVAVRKQQQHGTRHI